jgi:hypothetical protein
MYRNVLAVKSCGTANACPSPQHPLYAWAFAILFVLGILIYATCVSWRHWRPKDRANPDGETKQRANLDSADGPYPSDGDSRRGQKKQVRRQRSVYDPLQPRAKNVKAMLQMAIGVTTVTVVGWQYFNTLGDGDPTSLFLNGIGIGLAAAAALELAYTLFTDGPDEALDPLTLGLASEVSHF